MDTTHTTNTATLRLNEGKTPALITSDKTNSFDTKHNTKHKCVVCRSINTNHKWMWRGCDEMRLATNQTQSNLHLIMFGNGFLVFSLLIDFTENRIYVSIFFHWHGHALLSRDAIVELLLYVMLCYVQCSNDLYLVMLLFTSSSQSINEIKFGDVVVLCVCAHGVPYSRSEKLRNNNAFEILLNI